MKLSACVITLNEAQRLPACLDSLSFADEIVVLDSGSTDDTVSIARSRGARVYTRRFDGYGTQKNACFEFARGDWILSLDADERASPELARAVRAAIDAAPAEVAGFRIPRRNLVGGRWARFGGPFHNAPDWCLRLFRAGRGACRAVEVHEGMVVDGRVLRLSGPIIHEAYESYPAMFSAMARYAELSALRELREGRLLALRSTAAHIALYTCWTFLRKFVFRLGFLSGSFGLVLSGTSAMYEFVKYASLRELRRRVAAGASIEDLHAEVLGVAPTLVAGQDLEASRGSRC